MRKIENYACGIWTAGSDNGQTLYNSITGEEVGLVSSKGLDFEAMLQYARKNGGHVLRKMTFHERGRMLKALAMHLQNKKDDFYKISWATGATKIDSWVDIEGGIGNLFAYASLRRQFPDESYYVDGDLAKLSKNNSFSGHHICVPKEGVAIHINAYNFPVWGMLEKIAVNLLAGVPAVVKPAAVTSFLTEAVAKEIIASKILPEGALQLICGSANGILDFVTNQDVVTFTGSAETGRKLKTHPKLIEESVPFNMEADSLNAMVLGQDITTEQPEFDLFIKEVAKEMTTKCGQKCTAVRRILVLDNIMEAVKNALAKRLDTVIIGDPNAEGVRMGALAGKAQQQEVKDKVNLLSATQEIAYGGHDSFEVKGAKRDKGSFMMPLLFINNDPFKNMDVHNIEAFGPVSTMMPYKNMDEAIELVKLGKGSLVTSYTTADPKLARTFTLGSACMNGRVMIFNNEIAKDHTGHGSPMPLLVHGGPGRAGGGEEMGGKRGVNHYMQRTAIQGSPSMLTAITNQYQYGGAQMEDVKHPFKKHFEELTIGETLITGKRTVTETDIVNFSNVSWDHFYAHTDATSLEGTIFEKRVAHGYFILSAAAGLFVDGKKGPVLLNYGIDECRFTKPVYAGSTIGVKLTVKEKIDQEQKGENDVPKGIVKFLVDVYDETGETIMIANILTMIKKLDK